MKVITLDFALIRIIDKNIVVSEIDEGIHLDGRKIAMILDTIEQNIIGSYGYISNRINSYSTDLIQVSENLKLKTDFCCYGVVGYHKSNAVIFPTEELIIGSQTVKPIRFFQSLNKAIKWSQDRLVNHRKQSA
jgi:hypothetical protein